MVTLLLVLSPRLVRGSFLEAAVFSSLDKLGFILVGAVVFNPMPLPVVVRAQHDALLGFLQRRLKPTMTDQFVDLFFLTRADYVMEL